MRAPLVSQVRAWRPDALDADAERLVRWQRWLEGRVAEVRRGMESALAEWTGQAAGAAGRRTDEQTRLGHELVAVLGDAARALRSGAADVGGARQEVVSLVDDAEGRGFVVADDGSVTPPPVPPVVTGPSLGAFARATERRGDEVDRLATEAAELSCLVRAALARAAGADEALAGVLRGIDVPPGLAAADAGVWGEEGLSMLVFPPGWDPWQAMRRGSIAEWAAMVQGRDRCFAVGPLTDSGIPDGAGTGYYGAGFITGPDGRDYPLVVPHLVEDGNAYNADLVPAEDRVVDLGGADPGWHTVGVDSGVTMLKDPMSGMEEGFVGGAITAGVNLPRALHPRPDLLANLRVSETGRAWLSDGDALPQPLDLPPRDPRSNPVDNPPFSQTYAPGHHPDRVDRFGGALDLVVNAGEAGLWLKNHEAEEHSAYMLTLEQHEDGRTRALLRYYDVYDTEAGETQVHMNYGWVNDQGSLSGAAGAFRPPDHAVILPASMN